MEKLGCLLLDYNVVTEDVLKQWQKDVLETQNVKAGLHRHNHADSKGSDDGV
jgi:hypothetical protein